MTDNTTDHAAAIKRICNAETEFGGATGAKWYESRFRLIARHTDALAAQLSDERARVERLRELWNAWSAFDDATDPPDQYRARFNAAHIACLNHGDLDDPQEGS